MVTLKIGDKSYQLKLTTRNMINLERELGNNPVTLLVNLSEGKIPSTSDIVSIFKYCLEVDLDEAFDLYDKYIEEGNTWIDLVKVFVEVFKKCGYLKTLDKEDKVKNV